MHRPTNLTATARESEKFRVQGPTPDHGLLAVPFMAEGGKERGHWRERRWGRGRGGTKLILLSAPPPHSQYCSIHQHLTVVTFLSAIRFPTLRSVGHSSYVDGV